jgi:hypothetical protein
MPLQLLDALWEFVVVASIQGGSALERHAKFAQDPISISTKNEKSNETNNKEVKSPKGNCNIFLISWTWANNSSE